MPLQKRARLKCIRLLITMAESHPKDVENKFLRCQKYMTVDDLRLNERKRYSELFYFVSIGAALLAFSAAISASFCNFSARTFRTYRKSRMKRSSILHDELVIFSDDGTGKMLRTSLSSSSKSLARVGLS